MDVTGRPQGQSSRKMPGEGVYRMVHLGRQGQGVAGGSRMKDQGGRRRAEQRNKRTEKRARRERQRSYRLWAGAAGQLFQGEEEGMMRWHCSLDLSAAHTPTYWL